MDEGIHGQSPAGALLTTLDAYENWLSELESPGWLSVDTRVGTALLQKVRDIVQEAFPPLDREIRLLLAHAHLGDLVEECQVHTSGGPPTWPATKQKEFTRLAREQRAAIEALRGAVAAWPFVAPTPHQDAY